MKNREKQQKCINNQCCYVSERSKCKGHFPNVSFLKKEILNHQITFIEVVIINL